MTYHERPDVKADVSEILTTNGYREISPGNWKSESTVDVAKILAQHEREAKIQFFLFWVPVMVFCFGLIFYVWKTA